ncbi:DUF6500 family protein [bacterium]|jgi:hypothetical protein|nr:DUF6500 family protein [Ascidiaceihabitans sp.]MDB4185885.1 DUF6500 family protein [bacterium]HCI07859.1 hypothetical protein [Sulfitobacter sp.]MDA9135553.1 DUF6500 family protein [Ascidiaceihabitans sp.]MDB4212562.1 DUF6500 family protein [Ascidiaceihabitans sp.]MDB9945070.1 DUF6500 family protein [Ascidiaceihabitans sp.]
MRQSLRDRAISVCEAKIALKGEGVGLSFYAFFKNKNDDPESLMEAATWWIERHQLDHFVKAIKIREMIVAGL